MIIGLTGLAGSGKDTVAALLAMKGFQRYAFADELRREAAWTIKAIRFWLATPGADGSALVDVVCVYGTEICRAIESGELTPQMVYAKPTHPLMRQLLQKHGSEFRGQQDPNYWVCLLMKQIDPHLNSRDWARTVDKYLQDPGSEPKCSISDVRFPNEAQAIRDRGGKIWRIKREGIAAVAAHVSESGQSEIVADVELVNDGTVYELALKVRDLL